MNASNAKDYLPLVQALADGKTIQHYVGTWGDCQEPSFSLPTQYYRVKPEPREFWVTDSPAPGWMYSGLAYTSEGIARNANIGMKIIHVREVL